MSLEAFFLPVSCGRLFCLLHRPDDPATAKGAVIYVHPFAEEMNKSRRMVALQAKAMASAGYTVLQVDLFGCGDSAGDLGDASWESWVANLVEAAHWLREQTAAELWWWGLRSGALLAAEAASLVGLPCRMLMWQPVMLGRQYLQQFLRLRVAGDLLGGNAKGAMAQLKEQLVTGASVEIAGYLLSPAMAQGLEKAEFFIARAVQRVELIEVSSAAESALSPALASRLEQWRVAGMNVRGHVVSGPAFWQTAEIEECPALIDRSVQVLIEADFQ